MFNKRESTEGETSNHAGTDRPAQGTQQTPAPARTSGAAGAATIGPSISIDGQLKGEEDLVVEGRIKGTVELKNNTLTVGTQGTLEAEVFAHSIFVEGTVNGDLNASERISIRKSAQIKGNILAPRISLEDGAKFRGSIVMDANSEAFRKAFGDKPSATASKPASAPSPSDAEKIKPQPDSSSNAGSSKSGQKTPQPGKTGTSAA